VGIKSAPSSAFWIGIVGDIVKRLYLLPDRLTAQRYNDFLETAWRSASSCEAGLVVSARRSSSSLWRKVFGNG
jgi:hypothetical protein